MKQLLGNIRFYVLSFSILLSIFIYFLVTQLYPLGSVQIIKLTEVYALVAISYLYIVLMATPLTRAFTFLPFRSQYIKARRAIGVSTFYFALLHACFAFFGELGGFPGLAYLTGKYILGISLSFTALLILAAMVSTSFDFMVDKLGFSKWKLLHRFVYLAAILSLIHALMLGSQFQDLSGIIPQIMFAAVGILLILEAKRFDSYLQTKFTILPRFGFGILVITVLIAGYLTLSFSPGGGSLPSLGIHAAHIQLAKQAQQGNLNSNLPTNIPGLSGDRTRRFTASFIHSDNILANQDTTLKFLIYDASSGNPIDFFLKVYAYPMHLMVVDSTLSYFEHIHPTQQGNAFEITTQFPKAGFYHLYIQFQPLGGIEQQMAFTLPVGVNENDKPEPATQPVDTNLTKTFGEYEVTLDTHGVLKADEMTLGKNTITFTIKDAKTKAPITTLKPFMASFGHLTMINEQSYDFIHVHPNNLVAPPPDANSGPTVDFLPIGIYGPFKPGIYRAFGEFSTQVGTDFDTDFTIKVR